MKVRYENLSDVLVVHVQPGTPIADVRQDGRGNLFGFDEEGELVVLEIVDASRRMDLMRSFEGLVDRFRSDGAPRRREDVDDEGGSKT